MFNFLKKKPASKATATSVKTAPTFREATNGGWSDAPDVIPADGGDQADFVNELLKKAVKQANDSGIEVGDQFAFTITDIPVGIDSPHEIVFGLMMEASKVGLSIEYAANETIIFTREA